METCRASRWHWYFGPSSYRTYEEWKQQMDAHNIPGAGRVLTVPMRNGNSLNSVKNTLIEIGSYRTYEEWKHAFVRYIK